LHDEGEFMKDTLILGIETSCDETSASVVINGRKVLSNVIASQIDLHAQYGGVVPEIASRKHVELILPVIDKALEEAKIGLDQVDGIAVTYGPGLVGALLVGVSAAKSIAFALNKPLIKVNHIEGHMRQLYHP
jgi:N6-L-threonylcarbamoyladenine synthase